jgi:hypothetical protein
MVLARGLGVMADCTICGKNLALVGWAHICVPRAKLVIQTEPAKSLVANEPELVANAPPLVANKTEPMVANKGESRHGKYLDIEKRRAYMTAYMRKRREGGLRTSEIDSQKA